MLDIDRLGLSPGEIVEFEDVRAVIGPEGTRIGTPRVEGARVRAEVQGEVKGPKLIVFQKRRRKASQKKRGHRQHSTRVRVLAIQVG